MYRQDFTSRLIAACTKGSREMKMQLQALLMLLGQ